ncbi:MAG TPA: hypothetical protein GX717_06985 [Clostridiaceae bacterium]|nr:hypothetical protein [Clostridiaceae bacterium]
MDNKLLKISGILLIIGGGIGVILGILGLVATIGFAALGGGTFAALLIIAVVLAILGSVISLVTGILGVKYSARPDKAQICIVFGIITIAINVLSIILTVVGDGDFSAMSALTGLVVPVIYLVGAFQNKKQHVNQFNKFNQF